MLKMMMKMEINPDLHGLGQIQGQILNNQGPGVEVGAAPDLLRRLVTLDLN
jgi:hypothetical protein